MDRFGPCQRCGETFATNQKFKKHLARKNPCPQRKMPQILAPVPNAQSTLFPKDPNARRPDESVKQWGSRL